MWHLREIKQLGKSLYESNSFVLKLRARLRNNQKLQEMSLNRDEIVTKSMQGEASTADEADPAG